MKENQSNIITPNDIKNIEDNKNNSKSKDFIMILSFILIIGIIIYLVQKNKSQKTYSYTDEQGNEKEVTLDYTKDDLEAVYEKLDKIPLDI